MNPISYGHQLITDEDILAVVETLKSDYLTQGPRIPEFEQKFADYLGVKHACMVSNGTAALHLCAMALGIQPGDKVITTPITFVASANGFRYLGADIVFCDIDSKTFLMDLDKLEEILKASPKGTYKAVVPVDFAGYPIDEERLHQLALEYGFKTVIDACHAPGGSWTDSKGEKQMIGNCKYADLSVFSFHPVKHIAAGEGGAITTNNAELYRKVALYRTHGITKDPELLTQNDGGWYYEMQELGYNYRITEFQAALATSQLSRLDWSIKRRNEIAKRYDDALRNLPILTPFRAEGITHAFHLYVIEVHPIRRKALYDYLHENNIFSQVLYIPAHTMPYYKSLGHKEGECPVAEDYYKRCLALPMYPSLTDEDLQYIIDTIWEFYAEVGKNGK
ncbi:MAG: UDP-4-amino-4,6-dideoxy-N-acetyl-beta-L-altrosamine transaminase [Paludibacteraceae bacterium]|nr:UDP-4-amino-4,6-dideoxy-N-acetyl-beta-L-altrosamine transaminase [Paludibacteraceae bacterium]MBQ6985059.1 UDP-4-amino-4,6-dideoxy-N-acetyl-beta-L-altrosamine transaminase [Paludibacteraceae bacterium]